MECHAPPIWDTGHSPGVMNLFGDIGEKLEEEGAEEECYKRLGQEGRGSQT